jgi:hypothetical protein
VVGLFDHVPLLAVSVLPCFSVPVIVGGDVLFGAAARAEAARRPATATVATSANSVLMVIGLMWSLLSRQK